MVALEVGGLDPVRAVGRNHRQGVPVGAHVGDCEHPRCVAEAVAALGGDDRDAVQAEGAGRNLVRVGVRADVRRAERVA